MVIHIILGFALSRKEADIKRIFKVLNLDAHRRLRQAHLLGGLGDAQRPRSYLEDVYLVYVHNTPMKHNLLLFNNIIREKYLT
jgi:hypothetical protein